MGIITSVVAIGFLLIVGIIAYSMFGDAFDNFITALDERVAEQKDQADPSVQDVGNFADDTGTRVCNLKVEFVGSAEGIPLSDDIRIFQGSGFIGIFPPTHDTSIIKYRWFCSDAGVNQASFLDMFSFVAQDKLSNLGEELNLSATKTQIEVRFHFTATSLTNGNRMIASQTSDGNVNLLQFSDKQILGANLSFPITVNVPVFLYKVTEDDYNIQFWNEEFKINDKPVGHRFSYNLCVPDKTSC